MTAISKNLCIDKLDNMIGKYNRAVTLKPIDVKTSTYIDFDVENNDKDPKFKIGFHVRLSK